MKHLMLCYPRTPTIDKKEKNTRNKMQLTSILKGYIPVKGNAIFFQAIPSKANSLAFLFLFTPSRNCFLSLPLSF